MGFERMLEAAQGRNAGLRTLLRSVRKYCSARRSSEPLTTGERVYGICGFLVPSVC